MTGLYVSVIGAVVQYYYLKANMRLGFRKIKRPSTEERPNSSPIYEIETSLLTTLTGTTAPLCAFSHDTDTLIETITFTFGDNVFPVVYSGVDEPALEGVHRLNKGAG
jgi:hypothetical protein